MARTLPSDSHILSTLVGHTVEPPGNWSDDLFCYLLSNHPYVTCVSGKYVANLKNITQPCFHIQWLLWFKD